MPSTESDALRVHYQSMSARMAANPNMELVSLRSMFDEVACRSAEPEDVTYAEVDGETVQGIWCKPLHSGANHAILYFHGGGFVTNSAATHRKIAGHLAKAAGCQAIVVDFRSAPEHPFPAQLDDAVTAYRWLFARQSTPLTIITAGDSAGGNIALSLVLRLRDLGEPLPVGIIAFSPYLDMQHLGDTLDTNADTDVLITRRILERMSSMFLGSNGVPTDPLVSPLLADFTGLPPMFVVSGGDEALLADAQRLTDRARGQGVDVEFIVGQHQQHVFPLMAGRCPEADEVIAAAGAWVRQRFELMPQRIADVPARRDR